MARASAACRRLMTIPGVGQLTALAFVAAIDDPSASVARETSTRYKGQLKLKDWAFAIPRRSTTRKARVALASRLAIIMQAMLPEGTEFVSS
jgi:transposase